MCLGKVIKCVWKLSLPPWRSHRLPLFCFVSGTLLQASEWERRRFIVTLFPLTSLAGKLCSKHKPTAYFLPGLLWNSFYTSLFLCWLHLLIPGPSLTLYFSQLLPRLTGLQCSSYPPLIPSTHFSYLVCWGPALVCWAILSSPGVGMSTLSGLYQVPRVVCCLPTP